ncbi:MAG: extracellular solute-binding protein [Patescibacteria group bacterium]
MQKRIYFFLLTVLLLVSTGFGCKGLSAEQQASIAPVRLNYWTISNDVDQLKAFASAYQQLRSYVTVTVRQVRAEEFDTLFLNALADATAPDIISIDPRKLPVYQARLIPMPSSVTVSTITVTGRYAKETVVTTSQEPMPSAAAVKKNYIGTVASDVISGNSVYGLPLAIDTMAIYYNKDLLDRGGVAEPPKTWAEFLDAVKKTTAFDSAGRITQSGAALGTGKNIAYAPDIFALLVMQNGLKIIDAGVPSFTYGLGGTAAENHPTMEALRFYTDFARPTKEAYAWNGKMEEAFDAFVRGKAVFYFGFAGDYARVKQRAPQMNLEVMPMLQLNDAQPVNGAKYWIESVVKKSKHQNEAWDFVRFMTTPNNIKTYTAKTRKATPLRAQITEQSADPTLGPFAAQVLNAANWYKGRDPERARRAITEMIDAVVEPQGGATSTPAFDVGRMVNELSKAAQVIQQTL